VVGRLKQSRWTGNDGKQNSRVSIVAEHVEFRPEFKKEAAGGKNTSTAEELAAAAQEYRDDALLDDPGDTVMNEVLEPEEATVTF
jgi:single-strand DNA-binding protein